MRRAVLLLGVVALLAAGLIILSRRAGTPAITLANGVTVRVLGVSYGTNHICRPGGFMGGFFGQWIGRIFPRLARPGPIHAVSSTPQLVLFVQTFSHQPPTNTLGGRMLVMRSLLEDEDGQAGGDEAWLTAGPGRGPGSGIAQLQFDTLPHRSRMLTARFFPAGSTETVRDLGHLRFPNPAFRDGPPLSASPLPQTVTSNDLACTLEALAFGVGYSSSSETRADSGTRLTYHVAAPGQEPRALAVLRFEENGTNASAGWVVGSVTTRSAVTEAPVAAGSTGWSTQGDQHLFTFSPTPWPGEPWEVGFQLKRASGGAFRPDELAILADVEVPAVGETNRMAQTRQAGGLEIGFQAFVHRPPPDPSSYSSDELSRLTLEIPRLPEGVFVDLVSAVDDRGRALSSGSSSLTHGEPVKIEYGFREMPEGAKRLTFTLSVQRGRPFRFTAQPALVDTNGFTVVTPP